VGKNSNKPDLFAVLAFIVVLGVIASGLAQGMSTTPEARASQLAAAKPTIHAVTLQP
jgi:hypothetical protein